MLNGGAKDFPPFKNHAALSDGADAPSRRLIALGAVAGGAGKSAAFFIHFLSPFIDLNGAALEHQTADAVVIII